jgi:WD40 repeat protein
LAVSFSKDNKFVVSGSWDNTLKLWNVQTGECIRTFNGHTGDVRSVSFSIEDKFVVSGSYDTTLKLWNVETGECVSTFEGHTEPV